MKKLLWYLILLLVSMAVYFLKVQDREEFPAFGRRKQLEEQVDRGYAQGQSNPLTPVEHKITKLSDF